MDWYMLGRILGVIFWPSAIAVVVYGIGWAVSMPRPPHIAKEIKRWARVAAFFGFLAALFFTGRDFLKYAATIT